jgi:dTDP-4-dehydrorhamnose 3,5-epimerase-like enzyme
MYKKIETFLAEDIRGSFRKISGGAHLPLIKQVFLSDSRPDVFRGFHYYAPENAGNRLIYVIAGSLVDYALDLREESFGQLHQFKLSVGDSVFVPWYMAHGFHTRTGCSLLYNFDVGHIPSHDRAINASSIFALNFFNTCIRSERDEGAVCLKREFHSILINANDGVNR